MKAQVFDRRLLPFPPGSQVVTVGHGESFITFYPGSVPRVSAGIDEEDEAPVIGRQWFSWSPVDDDHFRWEVAPARVVFPSFAVSLMPVNNDAISYMRRTILPFVLCPDLNDSCCST
jgi:hypothetical protein